MKIPTLNLTIDSYFRNPLRWGKCPLNQEMYWVYGIKTYQGHHPTRIKPVRWVAIFYGKKYKMFSNTAGYDF